MRLVPFLEAAGAFHNVFDFSVCFCKRRASSQDIEIIDVPGGCYEPVSSSRFQEGGGVEKIE